MRDLERATVIGTVIPILPVVLVAAGIVVVGLMLRGTFDILNVPNGARGMAVSLIVLGALIWGMQQQSRAAVAPQVPTTGPAPAQQRNLYMPVLFQPEPTPTASATATGTATATATTGLPATPTQTTIPVFGDCSTDPDPAAAPNYPIRIVSVLKDSEWVTLRNDAPFPITLSSQWTVCSINGNQRHGVPNTTLDPGETSTFPNIGNLNASIWNNSERDDAALYDPEGRLISYWIDPNR